jgi:hypothetical protein
MPKMDFRERLTRLLDELGYDFSTFTIDGFVEWVAARRGRPIQLVPMPLPPELFGAWINARQADYIFYESAPPQVHTVHILLHELSHILLGHQTMPMGDDLTLILHPGEEPAAYSLHALHGLCRSVTYSDDQETEAETLSALIQSRVFHLAGLEALTHPCHNQHMQTIVQGLGFDR